MSFKKTQLFRVNSPIESCQSFIYKHCSVVKTVNSTIMISIVPHYGKELPESETMELLSFLGMDLTKPIAMRFCKHYGPSGMGDSRYYVQEVA